MDISQRSAEGLKREFNVVLTATDINNKVEERIASLAGEIKMPGFRSGKVPMSIVKTRYGKQVLGEVLQAAMDEATRKIIEENQLRPAIAPSLDIEEYEEGSGLKACVSLEVMPDIAEIDLSSLKIERPVIEISQTEVDEAVAQIADENKPSVPVKEARAVRSGDTVVIDFIGRIDGEAFEGGSAEGHHLTIGSNSFIPGFEEGLMGAKAGATVNVEVAFPENYPSENLAGKASVFEVSVKELREPGEVRIDDDFAKSLGVEDLPGLKAAVRDQLGRQHETAIRNKVKTSVLDALNDVCGKFDTPATLVAQEYENICRAMNPQMNPQEASPQEAAPNTEQKEDADKGMSTADKEEAEMLANRRVRLGAVLQDIGSRNNIAISEEDRNRAIHAEAQRHRGQEQQMLDYFNQNPNAVQMLMGYVFEDKVMDFIIAAADVTERKVTVEELYSADDVVPKPAPKSAPKPAKKGAKKAVEKPTQKAAKKATKGKK